MALSRPKTMVVEYVFFALLGLVVGSFLNLCIDRLPANKSLVHPPSRCDNCGRRLTPRDLIPVISYVWLRGRCRYCGVHIPLRSPIVELATATLFCLVYWHSGVDWTDLSQNVALLSGLTLAALFIVIFVIDLDHELILDKVVFPGIALALLFALLDPDFGPKSALLGAAIGFALLLALYLIFPGGFGWGDVNFAALMGLATGWPLILPALLLSVIGGGLIATFLLLSRIKRHGQTIPFGPFLATGTMITILWGEPLWDWYLELLRFGS